MTVKGNSISRMKGQNKKNIARTMLSVSGIVFLAKILGFVKQVVTANAFGATIETDIITISEGLVINLDFLLMQTLMTAFIPTYIHVKNKKPEETTKFVSDTATLFLVITIAISAMIIVVAPILSHILAPKYNAELSSRLSLYIRILAPVIVLIVEMAVFNALLKANESFIPGELISINQSVILIALILLLGNTIGPDTLVIGFYLYALVNLMFLMFWSRKYWRIYVSNPFKDENTMKMLSMMGPLILGYAMIFINQQVDKIIVSGLGEGTVTAMSYAAVLSNFVNTFVASICGVLFTYITQNIVDNDNDRAAYTSIVSSAQMITALLPISVLTILNSKDIVNIVFGRGKFDVRAISSCSFALFGYGFSFVPYVLRELFSRFQYGYGNSKTPMINSTIAIITNILLSIILSFRYGVMGVTVATSISVLICAILNMFTSYKMNTNLNFFNYIKYLPQWIIGIFVCVGVTLVGHKVLASYNSIIRFIIISIISIFWYFVANINTIKPFVYRLRKRSS